MIDGTRMKNRMISSLPSQLDHYTFRVGEKVGENRTFRGVEKGVKNRCGMDLIDTEMNILLGSLLKPPERIVDKVGEKVGERVGENRTFKGVEKGVEKSACRVVDRVVDKDVEKLTEKRVKILKEIENNNNISSKEMSNIIGINNRNNVDNSSKLKKDSHLERIDTQKGGYRKITNPHHGNEIDQTIDKDVEKDMDKDVEKVVEKASISSPKGSPINSPIGSPISSPISSPKTEDRIIDLIFKSPTISTQRIGEILGISKRAVVKQIRKLKAQNRLCRIGTAKGGHWKIINKEEKGT